MAKAGYDVILSNSRGPDSLTEAVKRIGARAKAGTREQAAQCDIVFLAVPWGGSRLGAVRHLPPWNNRILIDATNPGLQPGFRLAELGGRNSSQVVASAAPGARVVKTANTLLRAVLASDPRQNGGQRCLVCVWRRLCGKRHRLADVAEGGGLPSFDLERLTVGADICSSFPADRSLH